MYCFCNNISYVWTVGSKFLRVFSILALRYVLPQYSAAGIWIVHVLITLKELLSLITHNNNLELLLVQKNQICNDNGDEECAKIIMSMAVKTDGSLRHNKESYKHN